MAAFLKDITPFYGTGSKNEQGQDLESFLDEYDPDKYKNPSVTADVLVFQYDKKNKSIETGLKLLMIQRKNHPSIGYWALPGGFVDMQEDLDMAARRELTEETGLTDIPMQQLHCYGDVIRDPRTRIITVSYLAMLESHLDVKAGDDAADALWFDVEFHSYGDLTNIEGRINQSYELRLLNAERDIHLSAIIEYSEKEEGILKDPQFKVVSADGIAFDHPVFIAQALFYIKTCLNS